MADDTRPPKPPRPECRTPGCSNLRVSELTAWCSDHIEDPPELRAAQEALAPEGDREFETMWAFATRWNDMADLVRLMDSEATAHVENPDGTVESYIVPASALNRVLAFANGSKSQATKRALDKFRRAAAPAEAREEGPVATALALIPDDGLPDRVGEHFRVVTVCGHCGEIWSEVAAIHQQDTDRAGGRG